MNEAASFFRSVVTVLGNIALLAACTAAPAPRDPITVDPRFLNQQITITAPAYLNSYELKDSVAIEIAYRVNKEIKFHHYYGVRIFELSPSGWSEIGEFPTQHYPQGDEVYSPLRGANPEVIGVFPRIPNDRQQHQVRIYVIGSMLDGASLQVIAGYTDVTLHP